MQDRNGYMWFGTSSGLVKYNGKRMIIYTIVDGLVNNTVRTIIEDEGTLWIGTNNGISHFNGYTFENYYIMKESGTGLISSLAKFKNSIWFGTVDKGLFSINPDNNKGEKKKYISYTIKDGLPSNAVFSLLVDGSYLWIGTIGGGLSRFDGENFVNFGKQNTIPAKCVTSLLKEDSFLWIGTKGEGLFRFKNNKFKKIQGITDDLFYCAAKGKDLWFGIYDGGILRLNKNGFKRLTTVNDLLSNIIYSILVDREDSVWVSTDKGISKIITDKFVSYLKNKTILSICMFKGAMWFGTMEGLVKLKNEQSISYIIKDGVLSNRIWSLVSFKNKLWIGTSQGLKSFDGNSFIKYNADKSKGFTNIVYDILPVGNTLWLATSNGLVKFDGDRFINYTTNDGLVHNYVMSLCPDGNKIWIATEGGASCFDGNKFINYTTKDGLSSNSIRKIFKDSNGTLWFGTALGINKYDGKTFTVFTSKNGLSNNYVSSIIEYDKYLYLGTDKGLNIFDGEKVVKVYHKKNGLIGDESFNHNTLYLDKNRDIWFGSSRGVTKYVCKNDIQNKVLPPVYIEKFFVDESLVTDNKNLEFKYSNNNVKFSYIGLSFKDEDDVCYKYKLEGYDSDWSKITGKTEVRYTNLNNKIYTFKVLARNSDGYWSKIPAKITFRILPPFWKTWWFILIVFFAILIVIYITVGIRTAQIRKRSKVLEQRVAGRTRDFKESEEKYRTMIEHSNDMIWTLDKEGSFLYFNKKAEDVTGYFIEENIGKTFIPMIYYKDVKKVEEIFLKTMKGKSQHYEVRIFSSKKELLYLSVNTAPIIKHKKIVGTVSFGRDVTEQKKMEQELIKASKLESLGTLSGGIAHDFNNLLTVITGNISLLELQTNLGKTASDSFNKIEITIQKAKQLAQQLLTFARGGSARKKVMVIADLIRDSSTLALKGSDIMCEFSISDNLWSVNAGEEQIGQVINNMIINSKEAMKEGGIIRISAENTVVNEKQNIPDKKGKYVKIIIEDMGPGIPEEYIQKIFDPYFTTKLTRSGLGLAICFSIIKNHNGYINVESTIGIGTKFHIYLPASTKVSEIGQVKREQVIIKGKEKVLVMDDEKLVRDVIGNMLKLIGYTSKFAKNGEEAVVLYKEAIKTGVPFDVVILDLTIHGGMGGEETIKKLIEIDPGVKAIVSSGYSDEPIMTDYQDYGFTGVIKKPYKIQEFSMELNRVIKEN